MASLRLPAAVLAVLAALVVAPRAHAVAGPSPAASAPALHAGDPAPDFDYRSHDGQALTLRDLVAQGDLLLVFAPDEATLLRLEAERPTLLSTGVIPVGVLDRSDGEVWTTVHHLGLAYSVMSDPRHTVASRYGALDPATGHTARAWVVVDHRGRVRAVGRDAWPAAADWSALAAAALHRAGPGDPREASAH